MLTTDEKEAIRSFYNGGWNVEQIAEYLDLDEVQVLDYVDYLEHNT